VTVLCHFSSKNQYRALKREYISATYSRIALLNAEKDRIFLTKIQRSPMARAHLFGSVTVAFSMERGDMEKNSNPCGWYGLASVFYNAHI
jgi:hypothetical protein